MRYIIDSMQIQDVTSFLGLTRRRESPKVDETASKKPDPAAYGEKIVEYTWNAPSWVLKEVSPKTARTIIVIAIAVSLLFALMQEFPLILVIVSAGFLYYMLTKLPVLQVTHEVSTRGVYFAGQQFYYWSELRDFFFKQEEKSLTLCIDTVEKLPGRLFLNIQPSDKEKIKGIFSKRLLFLEEEPKDFVNKMYSSAISKFSLDK